MRIVKRKIDKNGNGAVILVPQSDEDLWHIYNLVQKGDTIKTGTFRKVNRETKTGSITSERVFFYIKLHISSINYFFGEESADVGLLLKGKNVEQNNFMQVGQMHTVKVDLNYPITIFKSNWDKLHFKILDESANISASAEIAALVMDEGIANLCLVTNMTTITKAKIEKNIPKKFSGVFQYDKAIKSFYESILKAIQNCIDFESIKAFVIASPGFVNSEFYKYLQEMGEKAEYSIFKANKSKFILVKSSSGYKGALNEVFSDPAVMLKLKDTKAVKEIEALDRFFKTLQVDADKVAYGHKYVVEAKELNLIDSLLICDTLFRTKNFGMRKVYVDLVDKVKECGGEVYIFSRSHVSGERLNDISGIAAILRQTYNMEYLDEKEDIMEKQIEEEEARQNNEDDDDKLSDVGSYVNDEDIERDFLDVVEEQKTNHSGPTQKTEKKPTHEKEEKVEKAEKVHKEEAKTESGDEEAEKPEKQEKAEKHEKAEKAEKGKKGKHEKSEK